MNASKAEKLDRLIKATATVIRKGSSCETGVPWEVRTTTFRFEDGRESTWYSDKPLEEREIGQLCQVGNTVLLTGSIYGYPDRPQVMTSLRRVKVYPAQ